MAAVSLCIRFRLPEAVTDGFREIGRDKSDFIQEPLLLAQYGNYFPLNQAGKFRSGLRFELHYYIPCKHTLVPLVLSYVGQMIWVIPEKLRRSELDSVRKHTMLIAAICQRQNIFWVCNMLGVQTYCPH